MPTHALESLTGHYSVGGFIGVLEARSRCSGISAAAGSTSQFFLCLQSPDCISFLLLGLCLLILFRSTCKLMTVGIHHPPPLHHQHDISVYACGVFMGALYIGFFAFVIPWQAGGRFIAAFSFLDNSFVLGIPHMVILCVWLLSVLVSFMVVPIHCQPLRSEASEGQSCNCPRGWGEE